MSTVRLINPVGQCSTAQTPLAPRLDALAGKTIGFISNIKPNADRFLALVEEMLRAEGGELRTVSVRKDFTSSMLIAHELEGRVDAVVNAWGD